MRSYINSDIYTETLNKGNAISGKIMKILGGNASGTEIVNDKLSAAIAAMKKVYKDPSTLKVIEALNSRRMLLMVVTPENNIPICLPFFKYTAGGVNKVCVNLTNYIGSSVDPDTGEKEYTIDVRKLHALTLAAYIDLDLLNGKTVLAADTLSSAAILWAKMFNKVLEGAIGLGTNRDRYNAFMYLAIKFFLRYYMDVPEQIAENIALNYLRVPKNQMILFIEDNIAAKGIDIYKSFSVFCSALFNNEITNIKGIKNNNISDSMNELFYHRKFIDLYYYASLLSLGGFAYFLFLILCADDMVPICNYKVLKKIIDEEKLGTKLLISIYKELR